MFDNTTAHINVRILLPQYSTQQGFSDESWTLPITWGWALVTPFLITKYPYMCKYVLYFVRGLTLQVNRLYLHRNKKALFQGLASQSIYSDRGSHFTEGTYITAKTIETKISVSYLHLAEMVADHSLTPINCVRFSTTVQDDFHSWLSLYVTCPICYPSLASRVSIT